MSEQPHPNRVRLLPWRISDRLVDAVLMGVITIGFFLRPAIADGGHEVAEWAGLAVAIVLLLTRRRYPLQTLAVAVVSSGAVIALTDRPPTLFPVALIALFTVGVRCERRTAIVAGTLTTVCFLLMITVLLDREIVEGASLAAIAWPAFAAAAGAAVRSARENVVAAQERAARAERSRELEAQRRVVEERLRIARDVHDLVAHHIAVINVQSGVAGHLLESDPAAAGQALDTVRGAASTVVDELGQLLDVLRSPDDADDPTAPTPDLGAIDDLVSSFAASGLAVTDERSGTPRQLSDSAEVAAYRVVQEGLTNAHKYGDGTATVALRFDDRGLEVSIANPVDPGIGAAPSSAQGNGFGLIGMRERIEAVGGTLVVDRASDGRRFEVAAMIPATISSEDGASTAEEKREAAE